MLVTSGTGPPPTCSAAGCRPAPAPVRAARRAALRAALPRPLAAGPRPVRRIRDLAEHDHRARARAASRWCSSTAACRSARSGAGSGCRGTVARAARAVRALPRADHDRRRAPGAARRAAASRSPAISSSTRRRRRPTPACWRSSPASSPGGRSGSRRSTHPGEEEAVAAVHRALAAAIPACSPSSRRATRSAARGVPPRSHDARPAARRCARAGELPDRDTDVYVADTIGELGLFYRLAPVVFIGGSLVPHGGQNPIEPAKLGAAILHGPHVHNFTDVYAALDRGAAALLVADDAERSPAALGDLLARRRPRARAWRRAAAETRRTRSAARWSARCGRSSRFVVPARSGARADARARVLVARRRTAPRAGCAPAGLVYGARRGAAHAPAGRARAACPVICVGNFTVGGAGKTPAAIALAGLLRGGAARAGLPDPRLRRPPAGPGAGRRRRPRRRRRSATSRCCSRAPRPTVVARDRAGRGARLAAAPGAASSSWTTACRTRRSPRTWRSPWSTARPGVGNGLLRPGRAAARAACGAVAAGRRGDPGRERRGGRRGRAARRRRGASR